MTIDGVTYTPPDRAAMYAECQAAIAAAKASPSVMEALKRGHPAFPKYEVYVNQGEAAWEGRFAERYRRQLLTLRSPPPACWLLRFLFGDDDGRI